MPVYGAWVCLLAPLAGFLAILLAGTRITRRAAGWIATLSVFVGFAGAVDSLIRTWAEEPDNREHLSTAFTWLLAGPLEVGFEILVDPLSLVMMLVVTGVGGLIVWYSMGYMAGEDEERRFFAYMALFVFSMLLLVQAGNLLLLLVGWGLVGLASYLLIGFYHQRPEAVAAAKKAFIVNAVGDALLALGLILLFTRTGTLSFEGAFEAVGTEGALSNTVIGLIALGLLGGAVAKSAQVPFHTWLPDAMEGPTPVSALIHAATMVTAGVYLVCRTHPIFEAVPDIQAVVAVTGAVTLLVAGFVALVQWDIKRVIAYSTMSQIGYMFLAAGVGAYGSAMFHLVTHAFFKALLFLAAGLVIHHLAGEQDIRRMGGLKKYMPFTHAVFLIGSLALVGIPPLAGFWSKDGILAAAYASDSVVGGLVLVAGLVGALLTGLYSLRLYLVVFHGEPSGLVLDHAGAAHGDHGHGPEDAATHAHHHHGEGPRSMTIPVAVLAVLSAVGGLLVIPGVWHPFTHWVEEVAHPLVEATAGQDYLISAVAVALGLVGAFYAWNRFGAGRELVPEGGVVHRVLEHKFYFDEVYNALFARTGQLLAATLRDRFEQPFVIGSLDRIATVFTRGAGETARVQTGNLRQYAFVMAAALGVLLVVFLVVR
ncbi:MAG: NADH-quinone oxidoreductase subunit L [Gaiella sp.]